MGSNDNFDAGAHYNIAELFRLVNELTKRVEALESMIVSTKQSEEVK